MHRSKMEIEERMWRSRLCQWIQSHELLHGTLAVRERVCGKSSCRCQEGDRHVSLFIVRSRRGKPEQVYVPRKWEQQVREWVKQYQQARELLEKVSEIYWRKVRRGDF